jgi:hypothetical protein
VAKQSLKWEDAQVDAPPLSPPRPELRLLNAVLFDAVSLIRGRAPSARDPHTTRADVEQARTWIERGDLGLVTFDECASWLGFDADRARQALSIRRRLRRYWRR